MPELRRDPIIGQWVFVHTSDSLGPEDYEAEDHTPRHVATCQFCPGREEQTPPEVSSLRLDGSARNTPGWQVRVVSNKFPALKIEGNIDRQKRGLFEYSNGVGAHEVLIETPDHFRHLPDLSLEEMAGVISQYQSRLNDLAGDKRFRYIVIFKNYGRSAGTTVEHAHSQIIALAMIPKYVQEKLEGARNYFTQYQRCVFCDIIKQEYDQKTRVLSENADFVSFCPFVPRYAFECWIMPKQHDLKFASMGDQQRAGLADILQGTLRRIKQCLRDPAYNFYLHIAPINTPEHSAFHWHIEIIPKLRRTSGFALGTGFYIVRTSPEAAAGHLREVKSDLTSSHH